MSAFSARVRPFLDPGVWRRRVRHPLSWMPDVPVEQSRALEQTWEAFLRDTTVVDGRHDSDRWQQRHSAFALCCVRVPAETLQPALDELRAALEDVPFLRLHPDSFLHIPIQELGFLKRFPKQRDEINDSRLEEFASVARIPVGEYTPFEVTLGPINSFRDAPFLDVRDNAFLARLHRRLLDVAVVPPSTRYAYLPHVTIGHYTREAPIGDLHERLLPFRETTFGSFTVTELDIITLSTDEAYPEPTLIARLPLATASTTTPFTSAPNAKLPELPDVIAPLDAPEPEALPERLDNPTP
ncbi:MAG: 2'-5' RNA ligase family protein [Thermomicrobiales bacterium]